MVKNFCTERAFVEEEGVDIRVVGIVAVVVVAAAAGDVASRDLDGVAHEGVRVRDHGAGHDARRAGGRGAALGKVHVTTTE